MTDLDLSARYTMLEGESLGVMMTLPDACAAAVITDPPYSSGGFTRGDRMAGTTNKYVLTGTQIERPDFAGDNRDQRGYLKWCTLWLDECLRITRPGGSLLMFTDWRQLPTTTDAVQAGGWVWRGIVPWDKGDGTRPRRGGFRSQAEYVVWCTAGGARDDVDECLPGWLHVLDGAVEPGWIHAPVTQADKHHITGKPTELMRALSHVCHPGELIFDPFAGSGTTGVGALLEGRRFLGVEKMPSYAAIARHRLASVIAAPSLFDETFDAPELGLEFPAPDVVEPDAESANPARDRQDPEEPLESLA
jgi:site-specific DNA-methyltransferase (adenine-specific)